MIANVTAGAPWMLTNRVSPSGENVAPANSASSVGLSANGKVLALLVDADQPLVVLAVGAGEREAVRARGDVVGAVVRASRAGTARPARSSRRAGRSARSARCGGRRCGPPRPRRRGRRRGSTTNQIAAVEPGPHAFGLHDRRGARPRSPARAPACRRRRDRGSARRPSARRSTVPGVCTIDRSVSTPSTAIAARLPPACRLPRPRSGLRRAEAVEAAERAARVLGQVGVAAAIEGDRLVLEAAHRRDRLGVAAAPADRPRTRSRAACPASRRSLRR